MDLKVSDIGEKELVKYIVDNCRDIVFDDAAITPISQNKELISTSDMLIQSKHFLKNMSYFQMGFKSVTVNVSDLAAMGARPLGFLLSIAIPKDILVSDFKQIIKGVLKACKFYNIPLIGGDTNEADEIIISGTALGLNDKNTSLRKDGYSKGDLICITGEIGLAALGFNLDDDSVYVKKALEPVAKPHEGIILKENGATSATDITDGLASELYEISKDSYGMMIYEDKIPISEEYKKIAKSLSLNYLDLILHVGEDFELLFTISEENLELIKDKLDFIVIGEINDSGKIEITLNSGKVCEISSKGYNHFK